jgi:hypothetical protein
MDFSQTLIRASALGLIMVEPRDKAAKDSGELSATAKSYLYKVYTQLKYKRFYDINTKGILKGKLVEEESITNLSLYLNKFLKKNTERVTNSHFTGEYDIYEGESPTNADVIWDIKSPETLETFIANLEDDDLKKNNPIYWWQLQAYMDLSGANVARVAYVLSNTPETLYEGEKWALLKRLDVVSEESPEFKEAESQLKLLHNFDDIPLSEKILIFSVKRDDEAIQKAKQKVEKAREYLQIIEEKHKTHNQKQLAL